MIIDCTSVDAFLQNLEERNVYTKTIHVDKAARALNGKTPAEATSFEIIFQATAIIEFEDGGQCLVKCGQSCGVDRLSDGGSTEGSNVWTVLLSAVTAYAGANKLQIRPGVIGI